MSRPRTFLESWSRRSAPERFDTYTRGSLYFLSAFEPFFALSILGAEPTFDRDLVLPWLVVVVAHTAACVALLRAGISQFLGGPPVRPWLGTAAVVLTVALVVVAVPTFPVGDGDEGAVAGRFFAVLLGVMPLLAASSPLLLFRHLLLAALGATLFTVGATVATAAAVGTDPSRTSTLAGVAVFMGLATFFMAVGIVGSYRVSIWMLGVVWEQDRTRVLHARLAVAEERLRFSRDLHDVFGRTLSVVAVKSELAAELAARGRPGAEEQMLEVRRIAQDALREVRAVVAGYRSADLGAELAGARSVLRSAGITTTVHGDETPVGQEAQEALAWAVREAVTNVVRHSTATTCVITVHRDGGSSVVEVVNDGVPATARAGRGSGLVGLAERLEGAGGALETWVDDRRFGLVARVPDPRPDRPSTQPERTASA